MAKHKKSKRADFDEDYEEPATKKSKPAKKGHKKAHKGHKKSRSSASLAAGVHRASKGEVIKFLKANRSKVKLCGTKKTGFRVLYRKTKTNLPIVTKVGPIWGSIKNKVYAFKTRKAAGGYGILIRGANYVAKLKGK